MSTLPLLLKVLWLDEKNICSIMKEQRPGGIRWNLIVQGLDHNQIEVEMISVVNCGNLVG